ncbi:MAG: PAS domain S-box protein [Gammaproteobacteria bacterium]
MWFKRQQLKSEDKQTSERRELEDFISALNTHNALIEFTTEGIVKNVNDTFLSLVGYQREALIGKHHRVLW